MTRLLGDDALEEITDEGQEDRFVAVDQLGEVHVTQSPHDERLLGLDRLRSLHWTQDTQQMNDASQAEIVLNLRTRRQHHADILYTLRQTVTAPAWKCVSPIILLHPMPGRCTIL